MRQMHTHPTPATARHRQLDIRLITAAPHRPLPSSSSLDAGCSSEGSRSQQKLTRRWVPTSAADGCSSVAGRFQHPVPRSHNRVTFISGTGCCRLQLPRLTIASRPLVPVPASQVTGASSRRRRSQQSTSSATAVQRRYP